MSKAQELIEMLNESPGEGSQLSKIILGKRMDVVRIVSASNMDKFHKALQSKKIKHEMGKIDLSRSPHSGHALFGFKSKDEDAVDDILYDDLKIKHRNPDSYDQDWSMAKL